MQLNLKGKVAMVAASSKGLGFGIAQELLWNCPGVALELPRDCKLIAQELIWTCPGIAQ